MAGDLVQISTNSAIDIRRDNAVVAAKFLNTTENRIYQASIAKQIKDISEDVMSASVAKTFKMIFFDCGYKQTDDAELLAYQMTRIQTILTTYYSQYTLSEVKLAFELCMMGELDNYLPRDTQGQPDRKHYQQFNAEYISRVMRAYASRRGIVFDKVFSNIPRKEEVKVSEKDMYHNAILNKIKTTYENYRDNGKLDIPDNSEFFIFSWLKSKGFAGEIKTTEEDRKAAFFSYIRKAQKGLVNKYDEARIKKDGQDSKDLDFYADIEAMRRQIKDSFDSMIVGEENIDKLIKFRGVHGSD